jgi:hypothetical protein
MKTKRILQIIVAVLVLGCAWYGRAAWRAHRNLVTLHVRNATLPEVARSIEHQTWERLRVDHNLDAKITLNVDNIPLNEVLDMIADQSGARWGKTYAVYDSEGALRRLETVLQGNEKLETVGWTNLAPQLHGTDVAGLDGLPGLSGHGKFVIGPPDGSGGPGVRTFQNDEEVRDVVKNAMNDGATVSETNQGGMRVITRTMKGPGGGTAKVIRMSPNGPVVEQGDGAAAPGDSHDMKSVVVRRMAGPGGTTTTTTDGDGTMRIIKASSDGKILSEDRWSRERLVLEAFLNPRLGDYLPAKATPETAAQTAKKARAHYVTYYALEKPPFSIDPGMGHMLQSSMQRKVHMGGTNGPLAEGDIRQQIEAEAGQRRLEELSKSPEQQVQRARLKAAADSGK